MAIRSALVCAVLVLRLCVASAAGGPSSSASLSHSLPSPSSFSSASVNRTSAASSGTLTFPPSLTSFSSASSSLTSRSESFNATSSVSSQPLSSSANSTANSATATSSSPQPTSTLDPGTEDEIQTMTARRLSFIVAAAGSPSNISAWLSTLGDDGKWPDSEVDYTAGCDGRRANWPAQSHWIRLVTMAAAWHGGLEGADQFVKDPTLLSAIQSAMDFWFSNDYTDQACLDSGGLAACPCGTPGFWNTNWFSNIILIPNLVAQTCLLVQDQLTDTEHGNCTHFTSRTYGTFDHNVNGLGTLTGANLLDVARIGIDEALLNSNVSQLTDAYRRIHGEALIQNQLKADGIRADGSFGQHGGVLYNGNYGKDYANDVLLLEIVAGGTEFAAGPNNEDAFATLIDGDQWMIYRNTETGVLHWDFSALGRFISFPVIDAQATGSININITEIEQLGELWNSSTLTSVYSKLASKSSSANVGHIVGNRMFFANDYMVQRGPGYITSVKMYSKRTKNTECLNDQNPLAFHLSDGTVYTYLQGNEYEDIEAAWDWNLIPGTTVDYNGTVLSCDQASFTGLQSFVGGVSNGKTGIAAQRFTNPLTKALSWQKTWFFLEDDTQHVMIHIVNSTSGAPIFSVLDQKKHNGPIFVDGVPVRSSGNFSSPRTLWHDNVGYALGQSWSNHTAGPGLSVEVGPKTGNWSAIGISAQGLETVDLFAAWLSHGNTTVDAADLPSVSYSAFPAVDRRTFEKKLAKTAASLHEIQNDGDVSAVYDAAHRTAFFVFWDAAGGSVQFKPSHSHGHITVNSSANAAVIYCLDTGNVTVSDPSQSLGTVDVTISKGGRGGGQPKTLTFALPSGGLAGSSVSQTL